ncbi:MAG: HNH endonuclease signature motif containing protein [Candidatus Gracilibacteria bacterium]|jgi:hypothetical protein|nr:HNH endonuclease signature motif containing protein [Candidatus Gracilibacteria bacterium]
MTEKDLKIHKDFAALGASRRECTNALLSLLPAIEKEKIWQKAGFSSIYDYALRLAGLSTRLVNKALKIDQKLENMSELKSLIKSQGLSKIEIISRVASKDTEKFWCDKARTMTREGLRKITIHEKAYQKTMGESLLGTSNSAKVADVQKMAENLGLDTLKIELTHKAKEAFYALKKDLSALSNRDALEMMLLELIRLKSELSDSNTSRETFASKSHRPRIALAKNDLKLSPLNSRPIKKSKEDLSIQGIRKLTKIRLLTTQKLKPTRHIPSLIRKSISHTCSFPGCRRPRDHIHHPIHFAHHANHINLKPLCAVHHQILHQSIVKNQSSKEEDWVYSPL